jgi:hypothetical protein
VHNVIERPGFGVEHMHTGYMPGPRPMTYLYEGAAVWRWQAVATRMDTDPAEIVIVTGSSGFVGSALVEKLASRYRMVGFDRESKPHPPPQAECVCIDLGDETTIDAAFRRVRTA